MVVLVGACGNPAPIDPDWAVGRDIYATCAACHGKGGEGGVGPAMATVLETFPDCATHIRWISLGSINWRDSVGDTYGATEKPVVGVMPSFDKLSGTELAQIAVYERVRFGLADLEAERVACGLG